MLNMNTNKQRVVCADIPYDSTKDVGEIETSNYRLTEEVNDKGKYRIFISPIGENYKIELLMDPLLIDKPNIDYSKIKVDGDVIYYMVDDMVNGGSIVKLDINKYTFETIYHSLAKKDKVQLFNVTLVSNITSSDLVYNEKILDFIPAGDCIILIKNGYVSKFDGSKEEILIDSSIRQYSYKDRMLTYEDSVGNSDECYID